MSERVWRILDILNTARSYLEQKGIENARGDAEALLGKTLGLSRIELYLQHERPLRSAEIASFREFLRRRGRREPLQLLLGTVPFCGVTLEVVPGLLIPRPETEQLAELVIEAVRQIGGGEVRVLDLGTGTGCIAVAVAAECRECRVDAVDVDFEAVKCAERNAQQNGVGERVHGILSDLFSTRFCHSVRPAYDVVVSNPPYVTARERRSLAPEVRDYESPHALVGGEDGLRFYRRIAEVIPVLLKPRGFLALELGLGQHEIVKSVYDSVLDHIEIRHDLAGIPRYLTGRLKMEEP